MSQRSQILVITYDLLRKLAKSTKYQLLYSQYKESGVRIFNNASNYTDFQIHFMQYLTFYANLNMDVYMEEVDKIVLSDKIYEDSYIYYKNKTKRKDRQKRNKMLNKSDRKQKQTNNTTTSNTHIVFRRPAIKTRRK